MFLQPNLICSFYPTNKRISSVIICVILVLLIASCKKNTAGPQRPVIESDAREIKLKSVVIPGLPTPYFHLKYNDSGYVTEINFASGFFIYTTEYANKRLQAMINAFNGNRLTYSYKNGLVSSITDIRPGTGFKLSRCNFRYTNNQLVQIEFFIYQSNGIDSLLLRRVDFTYHSDGNLHRMLDHRNTTGVLKLIVTNTYTNYDDGKNVDEFFLIKDFSDNLHFLPSTKLQKNNARNVNVSSDVNEYEIKCVYEYKDQIPLKKTSQRLQTRGTGTGTSLTSTTQYEYYQ